MPISRRALLISNPGEKNQPNYCLGVHVDVKNFTRLLTSAEGGAWELRNEITPMDRPTAQQVRSWVQANSAHDYVFIVFTGHGWYSEKEREQILVLRDREEIKASELNVGAKKRTIVLDCCRKVYREPLEKIAANRAIMDSAAARTADRATCRRLFDDEVQRSPTGIIVANSCAIDQTSGDDEHRGGRYSASLIDCCDDWARAQSGLRSSNSPVYSVVQAHLCATAETTRRSGGTQIPTIEKPRSMPYFPISVFG